MRRAKLSVVIACVNGLPSIDACLKALDGQQGTYEAEIIVANCCRDGTAEHIQTHFPHVCLLDMPERLGIPELRALGIAHATGDIICIIEDHCMARVHWFREIVTAHESAYLAVGGPVENGSVDRLIDWAVFLCEYSPLMPPVPDGEVAGIAGNNATYKREAFERVAEDTLKHSWEYFIHEEMKQAGVTFLQVPALVIDHKKSFGFFYFLRQRFHYSRSFAGMRRQRTAPPMRWLYALASPLLVPLVLYRIARQVFSKKRQRGVFVAALPLLTAFTVGYALGEATGYLFGPGTSLLKVE